MAAVTGAVIAVGAAYVPRGSGKVEEASERAAQYIRVFDAILSARWTRPARSTDMMISRYPSRLYPDARWAPARELMK